jgi:coenzyme F420-0:L-glutamate ligase / coenzyme F420-1:gamma-L-glutamate ligase
MANPTVTLIALSGIPLVEPGDDLAAILADALRASTIEPRDGDILVVAQKIVSKAEDRYVELAGVSPSPRALELAVILKKDPRLVEVILRESREVVRHREGLLIVEHRLGYVMANGGVDQSNIAHGPEGERVLLLPEDPDRSCAALKARLDAEFEANLGVIINDSFGRPWRTGVVGVAIGAAGLPCIVSNVGTPDLFGRPLQVTEVALADEVAAAASMLMGQSAEARPAVHIRGIRSGAAPGRAADLVRPRARDLFR